MLRLTERPAVVRTMQLAMTACWLTWSAACTERASTPMPADARFVGQWIWSAADSALYERTRRERPRLRAAIWVATITTRGDSLVTRLGRPSGRGDQASAEVVIRLDDRLNAWWKARDDRDAANALGERLARLLTLVDAGGAPRTLQLDYDAPVARLESYAAVLRRLRASGGALAGRELWITSLVAHLGHPRYGELFRPLIDGHIVQLFDTGERHSSPGERRVRTALDGAALPFRIGLGAFERQLADGRTTHLAWFDFVAPASNSRWYRGVWVFPAGREYLGRLPR